MLNTGKKRQRSSDESEDDLNQNMSQKRRSTISSWAEMQQYIDDRLAATEERRAYENATKLPDHGDEITKEVFRISSQLVHFREAGATLETQLSRMSKEVAKLPQMSEAV
ncbi:hypothetical protein VPNG_03304 [Cytospora leucostoma]|uniref:Uncharacterized protein n=1 Tax=Cytospora leucostoma TaxID=1230097 RepID=A0A423XFG6_9PEZI|nr:hypothetical protein VPNG_03304 [Cytospora leucostoma]